MEELLSQDIQVILNRISGQTASLSPLFWHWTATYSAQLRTQTLIVLLADAVGLARGRERSQGVLHGGGDSEFKVRTRRQDNRSNILVRR